MVDTSEWPLVHNEQFGIKGPRSEQQSQTRNELC